MSPQLPTALLRAQTDDRLARLAAAGSERAFEAIVERYRRPLLAYARRMLGDTRAEDVVQAAMLSVWKQLQDGGEIRDLRAWLYRVVHNGAINAMKRASASDLPLLEGAPAQGMDLQDEIEHRETIRTTLGEIAALPAQQRTALLAVCVQGRRHRDIGREMGVSEGAVKMLVHRARSTVRTAATALTPWPLASWLAGNGTVAGLGAGGTSAGIVAGGTLKAAALLATAGVLATAGPQAVHAVADATGASAHPKAASVHAAPASARRTATPVALQFSPRSIRPHTRAVVKHRRPAATAPRPAASPAPAPPPAPAQTERDATVIPTAATATPAAAEPSPTATVTVPPPPAVDEDLIDVAEDPPDTANGELPIPADGVPDSLIPPDTPDELADEAIANGPDGPEDDPPATSP